MQYFITRSGDKLMEDDQQYRFISVNIPNLHLVEDDGLWATNEWRFPDDFEINDALSSVKEMGGRAVRTYVISICRKQGPNPIPCHVKKPGEFNEDAFKALDLVVAVANRAGVRLIIPLVDNWKWWGGADNAYTANGLRTSGPIVRSSQTSKTLSSPSIAATITGTLYKDDKAILAWETGNELSCPYSWTKEIAAYLKSLDSNHLVADGFYIGSHELQPEPLADPNIDIVSSHHYPGPNKGGAEMAADIKRFHAAIGGKKVYLIGEFGFIPVSGVEKVLEGGDQRGATGSAGLEPALSAIAMGVSTGTRKGPAAMPSRLITTPGFRRARLIKRASCCSCYVKGFRDQWAHSTWP
jgi:hypothetical protein